MSAFFKFMDILKLLEDKGYVTVRLVDDYWHYRVIICEQKSVTDKLEEYLKEVDRNDYFYCIEGNKIWVFDTRRFISDFDKIAMEGEETNYFEWDELEKDGGRNYSFYYPLRYTFIKILESVGYEFEHPQGSAYCRCCNRDKINWRKRKEEERRKEIDDFIAKL